MYYDSWSEDERSLVDVHLFPSDAPPGQAPLPVHAARLGSKVAIGQVIARQDARPVEIKPGDFGKRASEKICLLMLDLTYSLDEQALSNALCIADFAVLKELFALMDWLDCPPVWSRTMHLLLASVAQADDKSSKHTFVQRVGAAVVPYADRRTHGAVDLVNEALKYFDGIGISNATSVVLSNFQWTETSDLEAVMQAMRFARIVASGIKYPGSEIPLGGIVQDRLFEKEVNLDDVWHKVFVRDGGPGSVQYPIGDFCGARWLVDISGYFDRNEDNIDEDSSDDENDYLLVTLRCNRNLCSGDYPFASKVMVKYEAEIVDENGNVNEDAGEVEVAMYDVDNAQAGSESIVNVIRAVSGDEDLTITVSLCVRV